MYHISKRQRFICKLCGSKCVTEQNYMEHFRRKHDGKVRKPALIDSEDEVQPLPTEEIFIKIEIEE